MEGDEDNELEYTSEKRASSFQGQHEQRKIGLNFGTVLSPIVCQDAIVQYLLGFAILLQHIRASKRL